MVCPVAPTSALVAVQCRSTILFSACSGTPTIAPPLYRRVEFEAAAPAGFHFRLQDVRKVVTGAADDALPARGLGARAKSVGQRRLARPWNAAQYDHEGTSSSGGAVVAGGANGVGAGEVAVDE